jgi:hypothetical protein
MIYKSYNFVESYSNADGTQRNSMVLGELGKVISDEPKSVISALKNAGVKLPKNVTRKELSRIIVANKRNRKVSENLAILIVASAGARSKNRKFTSSNMVDEPLPTLPASAGLQGIAKGTENLAGAEQGRNRVLQALGNLFKKNANTTKNASTDPNATAQEQSNWNKFQNWFSKNRDTIGQVAQTTYNSLQTGGVINTGGGAGTNNNLPLEQSTWIERNKGFVIVGVLAVLGGVVYFATKKK